MTNKRETRKVEVDVQKVQPALFLDKTIAEPKASDADNEDVGKIHNSLTGADVLEVEYGGFIVRARGNVLSGFTQLEFGDYCFWLFENFERIRKAGQKEVREMQ